MMAGLMAHIFLCPIYPGSSGHVAGEGAGITTADLMNITTADGKALRIAAP